MFPNSANANVLLLSISSLPDEIGSKKLVITSKRRVVAMVQSITSSEYQTSVSINKKMDMKVVIQSFLYKDEKFALVKDIIYKIERTYINGMFIELYLAQSDIKVEELSDE